MNRFAILILSLTIAGCGDKWKTEPQPDTFEMDMGDIELVEVDGGIGDGVDRPLLQPMTYAEYSKAIDGGPGCVFKFEGQNQYLFAGTAPDSDKIAGKAAIKIDGDILKLTHAGVGFAQLEAGGDFQGDAVKVTIERPDAEPVSDSPSSYFWPAVLKIEQDQAGSNLYEGFYACAA